MHAAAAAAAALSAALRPAGRPPPPPCAPPHVHAPPDADSPAQVLSAGWDASTWRPQLHGSTSSSRTLLGTGGGRGEVSVEVPVCLSVRPFSHLSVSLFYPSVRSTFLTGCFLVTLFHSLFLTLFLVITRRLA